MVIMVKIDKKKIQVFQISTAFESHFTFFYRYCFQNLLKKEEDKEKKKEKDAGSLMSSDYGYAECYPGLMEMEDAIGNLPPSLPFPYLTIPSFNPPYLPFQ